MGGGRGDVECLRGEGGLDGGEMGRESDRGWEDGRMGKGGEGRMGREGGRRGRGLPWLVVLRGDLVTVDKEREWWDLVGVGVGRRG